MSRCIGKAYVTSYLIEAQRDKLRGIGDLSDEPFRSASSEIDTTIEAWVRDRGNNKDSGSPAGYICQATWICIMVYNRVIIIIAEQHHRNHVVLPRVRINSPPRRYYYCTTVRKVCVDRP